MSQDHPNLAQSGVERTCLHHHTQTWGKTNGLKLFALVFPNSKFVPLCCWFGCFLDVLGCFVYFISGRFPAAATVVICSKGSEIYLVHLYSLFLLFMVKKLLVYFAVECT